MRKRYFLMVLLQIFIQAFTSLLNFSKQFLLAYSAFALFYPCIMFLKNILVQFFMAKSTKFSVIFFMQISYHLPRIEKHSIFSKSQIFIVLIILKILVIGDLREIFLGSWKGKSLIFWHPWVFWLFVPSALRLLNGVHNIF